MAAVKSALEEEQWERAEELLKEAAEVDSIRAVAYYELARLYFEGPLKDVERSKGLAKKAVELEPNNVAFLTLRLRQRQEYPSKWFPSFKIFVRRDLARKILRLDSTNAVAHFELAKQSTQTYLTLRDGISIQYPRGISRSVLPEPIGAPGQLPHSAADYVAGRFRFDIDRLKQFGIPIISLSERAEEAFPEAERRLNDILEQSPDFRPAYAANLRLYAARETYEVALPVLEAMRRQFPDDVNPYLYSGFVSYHLDNLQRANSFFDAAFQRMTKADRAVFDDLSVILTKEQQNQYKLAPELFTRRFWAGKDIRLLTDVNERQLEHYARMAYAELFFGDEEGGERGWNTDRGRAYLRYDFPEKHYQLPEGPGGMEIWQFPEHRVVFRDILDGPGEQYVMYSPPAKATPEAQWANDYVLKAGDLPARSTYAPESRTRIPFLVSRFKSKAGRGTTFYVPFGIRTPYKPSGKRYFDWGVQTGVFLIDPGYGVISQERRRVRELQVQRIREFEEATVWTGVHTVSAAPGEYALSVEFATEGEKTVGFERIDVTAPDFSTRELILSDLLLAYHIEEAFGGEVEPGRIRRGDLSIAPVPWGVFAIDQPIYLYFEIYNLSLQNGGASYQVQAALAPHDEDGTLENVFESIFGGDEEGGVSVQFDAKSASARDGQYLIMNASDQPPGEYVLVLRVRDNASGRTAEAQRIIVLE